MTPEEAFEAWAPEGSPWSLWAKPVLFATAPTEPTAVPPVEEAGWAPPPEGVALVVDLPGAASARLGLALARRGYRPVPLYNAVHHPAAVVPLAELAGAVFGLAPALRALSLPVDAPPVFLLDSRRREGAADVQPGRFDNRWVTLPQDFPSANLLLARGVRQAVLVQTGGDQPAEDLAHVLLRWQEAGIALTRQEPAWAEARPLVVRRPRWNRRAWYRALAVLGLRRNSAGGFGALLPEYPSGG